MTKPTLRQLAGGPEDLERRRQLTRSLVRSLLAGNRRAASSALIDLGAIPGWIDFGFGAFAVSAVRRGLAGQLVYALLESEEFAFSRLFLVAKALELASKTGQEGTVLERVAGIEKAGLLRSLRYSNFDLLKRFSALGDAAFGIVSRLKYPEESEVNPDTLLKLSDRGADRIATDKRIVQRLWDKSLMRSSGYAAWRRHLDVSFMVDHLLRDALLLNERLPTRPKQFVFLGRNFLDCVDMQAARQRFSRNNGKGALVVQWHGGFCGFVVRTFFEVFRDGHVFQRRRVHPQGITITDQRAALFLGIRSIESGCSVLTAPDAPTGKAASLIRVLGYEVPVPDGAPFIAYETRCDSFWMSMDRVGSKFSPQIEEGPKPRGGEKYSSFKERWLAFYQGRLEALLRGDPRNIALGGQWAKILLETAPESPSSGRIDDLG